MGDQAHQTGEIGEPAGHLLQQVVESGPSQAELGELLLEMLSGCSRLREQAIHVVPVSLCAGHPARGGVGLGEQASLLEGPHCRTHGGGAGLQPEPSHQGATAHWLDRVHVVMNRRPQHLLLSAGQRIHGVGVTSAIVRGFAQ